MYIKKVIKEKNTITKIIFSAWDLILNFNLFNNI